MKYYGGQIVEKSLIYLEGNPLMKEIIILFHSFWQLSFLRLGPLKGFLS